MSRIQMTQAVAADYADAMLVARRAKNVLFLLLALVLLIQLAVFFVVRYVPAVKVRPEPIPSLTDSSTSTPSTAPADIKPRFAANISWPQTLQYVLSATDYLGVLLPLVLSGVLALILGIMLVGRLVGVSHVTSAFCWSIVLMVFLIPWQSLFNTPVYTPPSLVGAATPEVRDLRIPGVLCTYPELVRNYDFESHDWKGNSPGIILHWARFAGFPVVALIVLLMIQGRSGRGLRFALGEAEMPMSLNAPGSV